MNDACGPSPTVSPSQCLSLREGLLGEEFWTLGKLHGQDVQEAQLGSLDRGLLEPEVLGEW